MKTPDELDGKPIDKTVKARLDALVAVIAKSDPARSPAGVLLQAIGSLRPTIHVRKGVWVSRPWYFIGDRDGPPLKLTT